MKYLFLLILPLFAFAQAPQLDPNKKTVCSVSLTSSLQVQAFKDHLTKHKEIDKYQFVELTQFNQGPQGGTDDWFHKACSSNITCDVLFMTGHFAGGFFGNKETDPYIGAETLRELSCTKKCENILRAPMEVYLFGCNTLAGKTEDGRTPEQYFHILTSHGMNEDEARNAVIMRYGAFGDTYKDLMNTAFHGQKMLYGYTAPAPASVRSTPPFKQYLDKIGSYEKHFDKAVERKLTGVVTKVDQTFQQTLKLSADQCLSVSSDDLRMKKLCELLYGTSNIENKMDVVLELLQDDIAKNLSLINMFFFKNKEEIQNTQAYRDLQNNKVIKDQLVNAANSKDLNYSLESLKAVYTLKLMSEEEVKAIMSDKLAKHLGNNTFDAEIFADACIDIPCDIKKVKDKTMFATNSIYNLPNPINSLSPELEQALVASKHKEVFNVMITVKHAGPVIQKKMESFVPVKTHPKDERFDDLAEFYVNNPASPKVFDYFISCLAENDGRDYAGLKFFKSQKLDEEGKKKLKAALPGVKQEAYRKTLENLSN